MELVYSIPSRTYGDQTLDSGDQLVSDWIDVAQCGNVLLRFEIESGLDAGEYVRITYSMTNAAGYMGGSTAVYNTVGRYEICFHRGDFDSTTIARIILQFVGRMRANGAIYMVYRGEDVLQWL